MKIGLVMSLMSFLFVCVLIMECCLCVMCVILIGVMYDGLILSIVGFCYGVGVCWVGVFFVVVR